MSLARGAVVLVDLEPTRGHEQQGRRPCIVVSDPAVAATLRFPLVCVVPVTGTKASGVLNPRLAAGIGGLRKESFVLIEQVRSIDKRRLVRVYGTIGATALSAVDQGLALYLGLRLEP
jgi:mRNA interferase MazF